MAPKTEVLKFKSGKMLRVRLSLEGSMLIKPYLMDFKAAIGSHPVYPPDLVTENGQTIQDALYQEFRWYYQAIADHIVPPISTEELDPLSRHQFFVCGDPVSHWDDPNTPIPDLSKLEKLLGYSYPEPGSKPTTVSSSFEPPSGDYDSYMLAALVLNFPESGLQLAKLYDSDFLNKLLKDAAYLSDPEKIKNSGQSSLVPQLKQNYEVDVDFENMKAEVQSQLAAIGVQVPEEF